MGDAQGPTQDRVAPEPGQDQEEERGRTPGDTSPGPPGDDGLQPDDTEPSMGRQAEFRAAYDRNLLVGRPPYAGVEIHTRGELHWILRERGWRGIPGRLAQYIDLRETDLSGAVLTNIHLGMANLAGAKLTRAKLTGAFLVRANLAGTILLEANLTRAILVLTTLTGANLTGATLNGAALNGANLSGAVVTADLEGVNLTSARMDSATLLGTFVATVSLDIHTRLLDVAWNGANLAAVQWEKAPRLGDEKAIETAKNRQERIRALTNASRAYRGLARALQAQGLTDHALHYRTRQYQLERKALFWRFSPHSAVRAAHFWKFW